MNLKELVTFEEEFSNFLQYMPNPDFVLNETNETLDIIDEMMTDPHIDSKIQELKDEVLSKELNIEPYSQDDIDIRIASFVEDTFTNNLDMENDLSELLTALEYGYSVSEIIWEKRNGYILPVKLKGRKAKRFAFRQDGTLLVIDGGALRELTEKYKFITFRYNYQNENPYGQSILLKCYWAYKFKKMGLKFWVTLLDRFGVPSFAALFKSNESNIENTKKVAENIADNINQIKSNTAIALANVDDIKILNASGRGNDFELMLNYCNSEISKAITGSILTSDIGKSGSYALADVHENTLRIRGRKLTKKIETTLSKTLVRWIVDLNFGTDKNIPILRFSSTFLPDWTVVKEAIGLGVPVDIDAVYSNFNIPKPDPNNPDSIFVKQDSNQEFSDSSTTKKKIKLRP